MRCLPHQLSPMQDLSRDANKFFEKGNKAAGVRARKKLQQLKSLSQELRVNIQKCKAELASAGPSQQNAMDPSLGLDVQQESDDLQE